MLTWYHKRSLWHSNSNNRSSNNWIGFVLTCLALISSFGPEHGLFGRNTMLKLYGMNEKMSSERWVKVEIDFIECFLSELYHLKARDVDSIHLSQKTHLFIIALLAL